MLGDEKYLQKTALFRAITQQMAVALWSKTVQFSHLLRGGSMKSHEICGMFIRQYSFNMKYDFLQTGGKSNNSSEGPGALISLNRSLGTHEKSTPFNTLI